MNKNFHNVSLGQGQEVVAEEAMSIAANSEFKLLQWNSVNTTLPWLLQTQLLQSPLIQARL